jgi:hypothetical protein
MNYKQYLNSTHWQKIKTTVYKKRRKCQICGKSFNLNIHHITYERLGKELLSDLVVLCQSCHYKAHKINMYKEGAEFKAKHYNLKYKKSTNPIAYLLGIYRKAQRNRNFSTVISFIDELNKSQLTPQDLRQLEVIKKITNKYRVALTATPDQSGSLTRGAQY